MNRARTLLSIACVIGLLPGLAGCEFGYKVSKQTGYRGTGTAQVTNVDLRQDEDQVPEVVYTLTADRGPPAAQTYQNVQVLGDLSTEEFNRLMVAITAWVSPEGGCNYCHNPENLASDEVYTKDVARRMIAMTRSINASWASHVQQTGVTCFTCHRGEPVPAAVWTVGRDPAQQQVLRGNKWGQNTPDPNVGYASLPFDPFADYLRGRTDDVRVASSSAYPRQDWKVGIKQTEGSYGLMMHLSSALGVNCTYCHNSQSFRSWGTSTQQRSTAFYGIRMVRDINEQHIAPLAGRLPENRLGPQGDPYKVNCATCHRGKAKPLGGTAMLAAFPELGRTGTPAPTPADVRITPAQAPAVQEPAAEPAAPAAATTTGG